MTTHTLSKHEAKAYQTELRRQGFHLDHRERSKHNGNSWEYSKVYETPNRLGTMNEWRKVEVQLSDFGCRASHMLYTDADLRYGSSTTYPTYFTTVGEMILAIALEVSRYDQRRYGIEHHIRHGVVSPTPMIIDKNNIVRVNTPHLPITLAALYVQTFGRPDRVISGGTSTQIIKDDAIFNHPSIRSTVRLPWLDENDIARMKTQTVPVDEDRRMEIGPEEVIIGFTDPDDVNSAISDYTSRCKRCDRVRSNRDMKSSPDGSICIDADSCDQSMRRKNFINGT